MPDVTAKILIPPMVQVEEGFTRPMVAAVGQMLGVAVEKKIVAESTANEILMCLDVKTKTRDFQMVELLTLVVDNAPDICNGGKKMAAMAYRVITAFEGKGPGDVVTVSKEAQELIAKYLDSPEYETAGQNGKPEKVKGWPKVVSQAVVRKSYGYQDAWCAPLTDKQAEELETPKAPRPAEPKPGDDVTRKDEDAPDAVAQA